MTNTNPYVVHSFTNCSSPYPLLLFPPLPLIPLTSTPSSPTCFSLLLTSWVRRRRSYLFAGEVKVVEQRSLAPEVQPTLWVSAAPLEGRKIMFSRNCSSPPPHGSPRPNPSCLPCPVLIRVTPAYSCRAERTKEER